MRPSKYWDDFNERAEETIHCLNNGNTIPVRRVAVFITNRCNMACSYCNHPFSKEEMTEECFDKIVRRFGDKAIIHITGGEPSIVKWLYPYLEKNGQQFRFHLNTNAFMMPPAKSVKRLKVSLDSDNPIYWNSLTGTNAFWTVVRNIKESIKHTVVSITFTMTKENYKAIPQFIDFAKSEFEGLYAIFFSVYKGDNPRFAFSNEDANCFFESIKPQMDTLLDTESSALLNETITEKFRIMQGNRFPENKGGKCYLSMSERVFLSDGSMSFCSHLIRDGIKNSIGEKHSMCEYGCNRRLVAFNEVVNSGASCAAN